MTLLPTRVAPSSRVKPLRHSPSSIPFSKAGGSPVRAVVCAWCESTEGVPEGVIVSHGICAECSALVMAEYETERSER